MTRNEMAELLIKIGDSGGSKDGHIMAIKPDGWLISPADMTTWITVGTEPLILVSMPRVVSDVLKRRINKLRFMMERFESPDQEIQEFTEPEPQKDKTPGGERSSLRLWPA